jgi:uncharacterized protein (TIGR02996 family)
VSDLHTAFLDDIAAHREDDTPRLIYADWLDDHGESDRARFIRGQCRLATLDPWEGEYLDLLAETESLLDRHRPAWLGDLTKGEGKIEFRRGFPYRITLPAVVFASQGTRAVLRAPTLSACKITQAHPAWDDVLACPTLAHFTALDVSGQTLTPAQLQALARSPQVANLRELNLTRNLVGEAALDLATSSYLGRLERLNVSQYGLYDAGLATLLTGSFASSLRSLNLARNQLTAVGLVTLARWEGASRLEELHIEEWGDVDVVQAFATGDWRSLRQLIMILDRRGGDDFGLAAEGVVALANCPSLTGLRSLQMRLSPRQSLALLLETPNLGKLARLDLQGQGTTRGLSSLARAPMLASLRALVLWYDEIEGLEQVLTQPVSVGLTVLELHGGVGPRSTQTHSETVAQARHLTNLRHFLTHNTSLDRTVQALSDAQHLANLLELDIQWLVPEIDRAKELADNPHLNRLRSLHLSGYPYLPKSTIKTLKRRFGREVVKVTVTR